jgi:hypothetical protein
LMKHTGSRSLKCNGIHKVIETHHTSIGLPKSEMPLTSSHP